MSVDSFVPEIWAAELLVPLEREHIYASPTVVNRNWEGLIANVGDTVRVNSVSDPTIINYVPNVTVLTEEQLHTADQSLTITESKAFIFYVDDVDSKQALPGLMPQAIQRTRYGFVNIVDLYISSFYTKVIPDNSLGTVAIVNPVDTIDRLTDLAVKLDEGDIPRAGRWAVVPPWFHGKLTRTDEFIGATPEQAVINGFVGRAAGFDIHKSNNSPLVTGDDYAVLAGTNQAISYAEQIPPGSVEAYRSHVRFADVVRGLHLYGAELMRPEFLGLMIASKT
ncbi:MAG: P22 coat protein - protein 5 domain protein [Acidobacteria bacterium]|nr:P22 coat protein - protein 5 domain protein [Acidobacteriota bacterium]